MFTTSLIRKAYHFIVANNGLLLIIFIWIISVFFVNPVGEFPLNDDWVYLQSLKHLYDYNEIFYSDWISSTLISQIVWGLIFCKIFGYSIFIARVSTMVATLLIAIVLNNFINKTTGNKNMALLITAVFVFNPVLYVQSFTFMTESSFNLLLLLCIYSSYRFIRDLKISSLAVSTFWGCIAVLLKQPGLIIGACLPIILLINKEKIKYVLQAGISLAIIISVYSFYMWWLNTNYANPDHVNGVNDNLYRNILKGFDNGFKLQRKNAVISIMYAGFYLLPILPLFIGTAVKKINKLRNEIFSSITKTNKLYINGLSIILFTIIIWYSWDFSNTNIIPCIENVFYNLGLGPVLLYDTFILKINLSDTAISVTILRWISFLSLLTGLSVIIICTAYFLTSLHKSVLKSVNTRIGMLLQLIFLSGITYTFLLVNVYMFDRYILALALLVLIMYSILHRDIVNSVPRICFFLSYLLTGGTMIFGVLASHDYMEWNRAKWRALNTLTTEHKISAKEIDGGYEFNGIHNYHVNYMPSNGKSWWWVDDNKYIVSMGMIPGYSKYLEVPYSSWLFRESRSVYVVVRN